MNKLLLELGNKGEKNVTSVVGRYFLGVPTFGFPNTFEIISLLLKGRYFWGGLLLSELYGSIYFASDSKQHCYNYNITVFIGERCYLQADVL